jgi:hypothetical protein
MKKSDIFGRFFEVMVYLCEIPHYFVGKFREIPHYFVGKFREINFYFRINFVFREIEKVPFVSTLLAIGLIFSKIYDIWRIAAINFSLNSEPSTINFKLCSFLLLIVCFNNYLLRPE